MKSRIDPRCVLPAPEHCRYCGGHVALVDNKEIYGRSYGKDPHAYLCRKCGSFVGVHPGTTVPLGTLADYETRRHRKAAHAVFDLLWKSGGMKRGEAYKWLAEKLGLDTWRCHIAWFDAPLCKQVVKHCTAYLQQRNGDMDDRSAYLQIAGS